MSPIYNGMNIGKLTSLEEVSSNSGTPMMSQWGPTDTFTVVVYEKSNNLLYSNK